MSDAVYVVGILDNMGICRDVVLDGRSLFTEVEGRAYVVWARNNYPANQYQLYRLEQVGA